MKKLSLFALPLCIGLLSSCGMNADSLSFEESAIKGEDNRKAFDLRANPYYLKVLKMWSYQPWEDRGNGRRFRHQSTCTGSLVAPNIVLTAAHCIDDITETPDENGYAKFTQETVFFSGVKPDGGWLDKVNAIDAIMGSFVDNGGAKNTANEDWAFVRIDQPLGKKYGYFDLQEEELSQEELSELSLRFVGFHGDLSGPRMEKECRAFATDPDGEVFTLYSALSFDCDMTKGSSGSAVLACEEEFDEAGEAAPSCRVVAVSVAYGPRTWTSTDPRTGETTEIYNEILNYGPLSSTFADRLQDLIDTPEP